MLQDKYKKKTTSQLIKIASICFNKFIRERDADKRCISCGGKVQQAGHFYSGGHYPVLRFNEDNVHGQCIRCNYHLSGNLNRYRINLINKIGQERIKRLDFLTKQRGFKWNRFYLIEVIEKYR